MAGGVKRLTHRKRRRKIETEGYGDRERGREKERETERERERVEYRESGRWREESERGAALSRAEKGK